MRFLIFLFLDVLDKKKKKEEVKAPVKEVKEKVGDEEKKKDKNKAHAPSHAKIRSIGKIHLRTTMTNTTFSVM